MLSLHRLWLQGTFQQRQLVKRLYSSRQKLFWFFKYVNSWSQKHYQCPYYKIFHLGVLLGFLLSYLMLGLDSQRSREEMGRQDSRAIGSAKNWAPSCTAWGGNLKNKSTAWGVTEQAEIRTSIFWNGDQFAAVIVIVNSWTYSAFYKLPFDPYYDCFKNGTCCLSSSKILQKNC